MSTAARVQLALDDLLAAVKELSPAELREFQRQFAAWSGTRNGAETNSSREAEELLLASIRENSTLPTREQRRFDRLRRKRLAGKLTGKEEAQLQSLWSRVEQMNATRLEALAALARLRSTDVRTLIGELGLAENRNVF